MKKNWLFLWLFIIFFSCNCNCEQRKLNLFENFYEDIPENAEECSKSLGFKLEYYTREANNLSYYAESEGIEEECIASGMNMRITYWKNKFFNSIQILELYGKTPLHSLGKYIGVKRKRLLKDFPEIPSNQTESSVITFSSENWEYFITFILEEDIVISITLGKNL